jgi:hypothetical protein
MYVLMEQMRVHMAVRAIDGTSHRIYRPEIKPQELYYSGQRQYYLIQTQIIVANACVIRYLETAFIIKC